MRGKTIKTVASVLLFCVLFAATGRLLRYLLWDDTSSYTRVTYHEMYAQDNIDVLLVGSSHCYRSFDPAILDRELGQNTFNAGSSSQYLDGSYLLIREAARHNKLSHVYLEVYFGCATDVKAERESPVSTYIISSYLKPSLDKLVYLLQATGKAHYGNSFFVARRDWSKLTDLDYIRTVLIKKSTAAYKSYGYDRLTDETEWYAGKGYVANNGVVNDWDFFSESAWEPIDVGAVSADWKSDLESIIRFCEKKQIPLTLVVAPMSDYLLAGVGNYDDYIACVRELIDGRDVELYDFNLCRETAFPSASELFKDPDHVNCAGAELFSTLFARLVKGEVTPEEIFFSSYAEKLESLPPTVFGAAFRDEAPESGAARRLCRIVSNAAPGTEYRITLVPSEGEAFLLRDYAAETSFSLDPEQSGRCVIEWRNAGETESAGERTLTLP